MLGALRGGLDGWHAGFLAEVGGPLAFMGVGEVADVGMFVVVGELLKHGEWTGPETVHFDLQLLGRIIYDTTILLYNIINNIIIIRSKYNMN